VSLLAPNIFRDDTLITDNYKKCPTRQYLWAADVSMYAITKQWDNAGARYKILPGFGISVSKNKVCASGHCPKVPQDIENYFVVNDHSILNLSKASIYGSLVWSCLCRLLSATQ